jgi:tryptophan-rich sensory protein
LWTIIFFAFGNPGLACIEIIVLWIAIRATMAAFGTVSSSAQLLLVPYMLWVSFAAYLNFGIWFLNR